MATPHQPATTSHATPSPYGHLRRVNTLPERGVATPPSSEPHGGGGAGTRRTSLTTQSSTAMGFQGQQVPKDWRDVTHWTVASTNTFVPGEAVIVQRTDGRRTFGG